MCLAVHIPVQTPLLVSCYGRFPVYWKLVHISLQGPSKLDPHMERLLVDAVLGRQVSLWGRLPYITSSLYMRCAHVFW